MQQSRRAGHPYRNWVAALGAAACALTACSSSKELRSQPPTIPVVTTSRPPRLPEPTVAEPTVPEPTVQPPQYTLPPLPTVPPTPKPTTKPTAKPTPKPTVKPAATPPPAPEPTVPAPAPSTTVKPKPSTTVKPKPSTTVKPKPSTTIKPKPSTTVAPEPTTPPTPDPTEPPQPTAQPTAPPPSTQPGAPTPTGLVLLAETVKELRVKHPTLGPLTLVGVVGANGAGEIRALNAKKAVVWKLALPGPLEALGPWKAGQPEVASVDGGGHVFLRATANGASRAIVLTPVKKGFARLAVGDDSATGDEVGDLDGDGWYEIVEHSPVCNPTCADRPVDVNLERWRTNKYVAEWGFGTYFDVPPLGAQPEARGNGCPPGIGDQLPDGWWLVQATAITDTQISYDGLCAWTGARGKALAAQCVKVNGADAPQCQTPTFFVVNQRKTVRTVARAALFRIANAYDGDRCPAATAPEQFNAATNPMWLHIEQGVAVYAAVTCQPLTL